MANSSNFQLMFGIEQDNQSSLNEPGDGMNPAKGRSRSFDLLHPARAWLDAWQIHELLTARLLSRLIPAQCPFERDIKLFGRTLFHIPPLCKLNPLYEQLVGLRFRALCFLADECGEDIRSYV
ncbi:MAG: Mo-dependent nitrogenase C-terminal domain-containing protein [Hormoscilla sp. SP5CHS1]|nr:Mo-dependent nitrogenase C-terminal domain-containing protein [Hormoscilla sp. SP12CHS1]MBC6455756.1 Mo-dependent nitrogenase C-terminal domain-containing protein [Hormoscilla sp. SP5CHS1]